MKRASSTLLLSYLFIILFLATCKDDDKSLNPIPTAGACLLATEATNLSGNAASWVYEYDKNSKPTKITRNNASGSPSYISEIGSAVLFRSAVTGPAVPPNIMQIDYEGSIDSSPTKAYISITVDDITYVHSRTYFFFYDTKGRLNLVGEQTDNVMGDLEYDLHIFYNDQDNVTGLSYEITTGPNKPGSVVTVKAYDDKPSPYTGVKGFPFIMNNFAWDNYDPEPIITALSKNNPLDYAMNAGTEGEFLRTMTYEYNEQGYPTIRSNTNKNASGQYTFLETFTYTCK